MEASTESARYLYSGDKVILETDLAGNTKAVNIYGMNLISRTDNGTKLYYLYNAHADVTGLADSGGNITATYRYDEESDLYYLNARYYDPKIARFLSVDTYKGQLNDPLSLNLYTYCVNNPIVYYAPTGHIVTDWDKENLSKKDRKKIRKNTREWDRYDRILKDIDKNTKTYKIIKNLRDKKHRKAERIRNKKRDKRREKGRDDGYTVDRKTGNVITTRKDTNSVEPGPSMPLPTAVLLYAAQGMAYSSENYSHKYDYRDIITGNQVLVADSRDKWTEYYFENIYEDNTKPFEESLVGDFLERVNKKILEPYAKSLKQQMQMFVYADIETGEVIGSAADEFSDDIYEFSATMLLVQFFGENLKSIPKAREVFRGTDKSDGVFGKNTVGAAEKYTPSNIKMVKDKYLKKNGIDAHALKQDFVGKKNIAHFDIYVDKDSGMLWIYRKGGIGEAIPTYEYIK